MSLTTTNTLFFLLCVLMRQILGQTKGISHVKIFAQQKSVGEGSDLYLTCSTFGLKNQTMVYVYLCKDGVGMKVKKQEKEKNDTPFTITGVGLHHSGNYSCIYSDKNSEPSTVRETGANQIQIDVISSFLPADISLVSPSTITEGDGLQFRCTFTKSLQTLGGCNLIQSHLRRKETLVQEQEFNVTRKETIFTIEGTAIRDSGPYSCVLLPSKCITENQRTVSGNNKVLIEVKGSLQPLFYFGVICLILSLGVCLWTIFNRRDQLNIRKEKVHTRHISSSENQQPDTQMLEEQQEQVEDVESQDSGSFSEDEEEQDQSGANDNSSYYNDNEDGVYSYAVDPPTTEYTYSTCRKKKTERT